MTMIARQVAAAHRRVGALRDTLEAAPGVVTNDLRGTLDTLQTVFADLRSIEQSLQRYRVGSAAALQVHKDRFVFDLLHDRIHDEESIPATARQLGLDFGPPRAVILIDISADLAAEGDEAYTQLRVQQVIAGVVRFFHLPNDTICAYLGEGQLAVLKASNTRNLSTWAQPAAHGEPSASWADLGALKRAASALYSCLREETGAAFSIGIGRYHPGLRGLASSYQDARAALSLGQRSGTHQGVHCLSDLGIAAFVGVSDEQTKVDLATYLLSPLNDEHDLLATLTAFFAENCYPSATARRLVIHRNTLSYRLDKVAALTGLDPRCFDDALQIRLALLLRSLASR